MIEFQFKSDVEINCESCTTKLELLWIGESVTDVMRSREYMRSIRFCPKCGSLIKLMVNQRVIITS